MLVIDASLYTMANAKETLLALIPEAKIRIGTHYRCLDGTLIVGQINNRLHWIYQAFDKMALTITP